MSRGEVEFEKYREFVSRYIAFNTIEWHLFKSKLYLREFSKGDIILHQGDVCGELLFITEGLARGYIINEDGKDFTWSIFFNEPDAHMTNLFLVEYDSFLRQTPSSIHIEALERCVALGVSYDDVQSFYKHLKKGERFGRLMAEDAYLYTHQFIIRRQTRNAAQRFADFMETTPHLLDKVPQYHIASFLGITPQHLSRLKKEYKPSIR